MILIPINKAIASKIGRISVKLMEQKDQRVSATAEMLLGVRVLKMHVWEQYFLERICRIRDSEVKHLKARKYLDALCVYFWATTPILISIFTFATYSLLGNQLTAATVFTTLALLNMLIAPLNAFPWILNGLTEAWVSLTRIQRLMDAKDNNFREYFESNPINKKDVFVLEHCSFQWETQEEKKTEEVGFLNLGSLLHCCWIGLKNKFIFRIDQATAGKLQDKLRISSSMTAMSVAHGMLRHRAPLPNITSFWKMLT